MKPVLCFICWCSLFFSIPAFAGPPYDTDDPEPVDFHHREFYCSSIGSEREGTSMGTAPHAEVNYGVLPDVGSRIEN